MGTLPPGVHRLNGTQAFTLDGIRNADPIERTYERLAYFSSTAFFKQDLRNAPVQSDSGLKVAEINSQVVNNWGGRAAFNASQYGANIFRTSNAVSPQDMTFTDCQNKGYRPDFMDRSLLQARIPSGTVPTTGSDKSFGLFNETTNELREFWIAEEDTEGNWSACHGGRIDDTSVNFGQFADPEGNTATGIPHAAVAVTVEEVRRGIVDHCVGIILITPATFAQFSWPANRADGEGWATDPKYTPEGTRLRLSQYCDVEKLELHPIARMIARAAKVYGMVIIDKGGSVGVIAESGDAHTVSEGTNPWPELYDGTPEYEIMANFPWGALEVIEHDWGKPV